MESLANYLNKSDLVDREGNNLKFEMVDGWEDYGAGMKWTSIFYKSNGYNVWALNPSDWIKYMNGASKEEILNDIIKGEYSSIRKRTK